MLLNRPKLHQLMEVAGIDALVVTYTQNVIYFSDFLHVNSDMIKSRLYYLVYFADERFDPVFLVPHQDSADARRSSWIADIRETAEFPFPGRSEVIVDKEAEVTRVLAERGLSTGVIGFEDATLPYNVWRRMSERLRDAKWVGASELVARLRAVKSAEELRRIRGAMHATQAGARAILANAKEGVSEIELAQAANEACLAAGAESVDFIIVGASVNGAIVHGAPTDYRLADGDIVRFDLGASYGSYPGDFARTFAVGKNPLDRDVRLYEAMKEAVRVGVEGCRPGTTAGEVYDAMMQAGRAIDPELKREHAGHGLGLEVHEEPMIYSGSRFVLEPGMVVMIECGRYIAGQGGYQLEDLVLVTESEPELLTDVPRDLLIS